MNKNNRIFKFRIWDKKSNEFIDYNFELGDGEGYIGFNSNHEIVYKEDCIFNQFVGLQDKSGRDIFENDILKFFISNYQGQLSREAQGTVIWSTELCKFHVETATETFGKPELYNLWECHERKIIGNVYKNRPENNVSLEDANKFGEKLWETNMEDGYNS